MVEKEYVTSSDLDYMRNQNDIEFGQMIFGMSSLLKQNVSKLEEIKNQGWCKRMYKTVLGSNEVTLRDIQVNHEKLSQYTIQALSLLFKEITRNRKIMIGLSNQINELYVEHIKLKKLLGDFAYKLNRKIESIDNFFVLNKEIEQGKYSLIAKLEAMCNILAQLDNRTLLDERKINIIRKSVYANVLSKKQIMIHDSKGNSVFRKIWNKLFKKDIINKNEEAVYSFPELLIELLKHNDGNVGIVLLELSNYDDNSDVKAIYDALLDLHSNSINSNEIINKVPKVLEKFNVDCSQKCCLKQIFDDMLEEKILRATFVEAKDKYYANDIDLAYELFHRLDSAGFVRAKWFLGSCLKTRFIDVERRNEIIDEYYYQGYIQGDLYAQASYILGHKNNFVNDISDIVRKLYGMTLNGDLQALLILAQDIFVENSSYNFVDNKKILELLQEASENDCWIATQIITHYLWVVNDHENVFCYASKGTDQGVSYCQVILAVCYMWGYGTEPSIIEAEKHCRGALEKKTEFIDSVKTIWINAIACCGYVNLGTCFYVAYNMVESKLKNANESYVKNIFGYKRDEKDIVMLYDPTWLGGAKEGFVVFQDGIALNYKSVRGFIEFGSIKSIGYSDGYVTITNDKQQKIKIAELDEVKYIALKTVIDNLVRIYKFNYGMAVPDNVVTDEFRCEKNSLLDNDFLKEMAKVVVTEVVSNALIGKKKPWYKKW